MNSTKIKYKEYPEYELQCSCCKKKFKTTDPKQELCMQCLLELIEVIDEYNHN